MNPYYNDSDELDKYLWFNRQQFMMPLERRAEYLGTLREKAFHMKTARERLTAEYEAQVDESVLQLIGTDFRRLRSFQNLVSERIKNEALSG